MKTLILVRHAKSDWPEDTEDFDRPLAEKGFADAIKMSDFLQKSNLCIDCLITSPALRAKTTCEVFQKAFPCEILENKKLYHPSENNFLSVIFDIDNQIMCPALFSHNNGISNFANSLTEDAIHFPTCGVAVVHAECDNWTDFETAPKKLIHFFEPNKI